MTAPPAWRRARTRAAPHRPRARPAPPRPSACRPRPAPPPPRGRPSTASRIVDLPRYMIRNADRASASAVDAGMHARHRLREQRRVQPALRDLHRLQRLVRLRPGPDVAHHRLRQEQRVVGVDQRRERRLQLRDRPRRPPAPRRCRRAPPRCTAPPAPAGSPPCRENTGRATRSRSRTSAPPRSSASRRCRPARSAPSRSRGCAPPARGSAAGSAAAAAPRPPHPSSRPSSFPP